MEAINTFNKGINKDTHPLTTPNDVLTDALNATLITYNGNEMILQNDMGNTTVGTACLPAGYVPVGVKEHGGIVYVAAYNPKTKKGQVGSFPSPLQQYIGEEAYTVDTLGQSNGPLMALNIDLSNFYRKDSNNNITDFIANEKLTTPVISSSDGENRILHPGDKFKLVLNLTDLGVITLTSLNALVTNGKLTVKLGVVKNDGSIEIITDKINEIFTSDYQIFTSRSSGYLLLILTITTLDSFELYKDYKIIDNKINVNITGIGKLLDLEYRTNVSYANKPNLRLIIGDSLTEGSLNYNEDLDKRIQKTIEIAPGKGSNTVVFKNTIYPMYDWGVIEKMGKYVNIDTSKIQPDKVVLKEWRFFVADEYIRLNWSLDYYNLKGDDIDHIEMKFYDIRNTPKKNQNETYEMNLTPDYTLDFYKDYYSGNFEDFIRYENSNIKKGNIYIVQINAIKPGLEDPDLVAYKMLYTTSLYNNQFNNVNMEEDVVEFKQITNLTANISIVPKLNYTITSKQYKIMNPKDISSVRTNNLELTILQAISAYWDLKPLVNTVTREDYYNNIAEVTTNNELLEYRTLVINNYEGTVEITCEEESLSKYVGEINKEYLNWITGRCEILNGDTEEVDGKTTYRKTYLNRDEVDWNVNQTVTLYPEIPKISSKVVNKKENEELTILFTDERCIQGRPSGTLDTPISKFDKEPLYSREMSATEKDRVFVGWNTNQVRVLAGDCDDSILHNVELTGSGDIIGDNTAGAGVDEAGLEAAFASLNEVQRPMCAMFAGWRGKYAKLNFGVQVGNNSFDFDFNSDTGSEYNVETDDNYLLPVWKFTDNVPHFVNLMSRKYNYESHPPFNKRLDYMLKCFLSQMFIYKETLQSINYITTNENAYRYLTGKSKLNISITIDTSYRENDTMPRLFILRDLNPDNDASEVLKTPQEWLEAWGFNSSTDSATNITTTKILGDIPFHNLIPEFNLNNADTISTTIELNDSFNMDEILKFYMGINPNIKQSNVASDMHEIFVVKADLTSLNAGVSLFTTGEGSGIRPIPSLEGSFEWTGLPALLVLTETDRLVTTIYDWSGELSWKFFELGKLFITRSKLEQWNSIDTDNEVLARYKFGKTGSRNYLQGYWTHRESAAPDMCPYILYSNKSLYLERTHNYFNTNNG